jgi:hypothetical protein
MHVSWVATGHKHDLDLTVIGERGSIQMHSGDLNRLHLATSPAPGAGYQTVYAPAPAQGKTSHGVAIGFDHALALHLGRFVSAIADPLISIPTLADGLAADAVIAAAEAAATNLSWERPDAYIAASR